MRVTTKNRLVKLALVLLLEASLAACGRREITTTTTYTSAAALPAGGELTASGVEAASAAGITPQDIATADPVQADGAAASASDPRRTRRGLLVTGAVVAGSLADNATTQGFGLAGNAPGPVLTGGTGAQCSNPFGGQPAANGQAICAATGERLICQCSDDSCQLLQSKVSGCGPAGAVVN